ncbi:type II toxin-antitoxin system CcdA family antitoxin [Xenorhabdus sp. DI]|uniref:type II toxin-antitoxin system CcdA family antitoxin n=1 Tax=Xenorhabdus doucetiae TaxID=351671 RepID=UPI0019CF33D8|nr:MULTISPECIES: type II toxin-antitoxin system CcdA family antitoxin [unclassified Xenorhabdus]MBD2783474.1 type II toxin-antitoxin system CcdA family antitoxin [Xenorhabdus sp. 3]MBD2787720.1 type II toxin-antitoxin system CcdA family antitoxin [Xenorhabdus sp. DI]
MTAVHTRTKKTVSVTVSPELYQQAKQMGLNFSAILTQALISELKNAEAERWKRENKLGLEELNRITREHGLLSDQYRTF